MNQLAVIVEVRNCKSPKLCCLEMVLTLILNWSVGRSQLREGTNDKQGTSDVVVLVRMLKAACACLLMLLTSAAP